MKSLAGVAPYLHGVGVAVNREMYVWDHSKMKPEKRYITVWSGECFLGSDAFEARLHACEVETDDEPKTWKWRELKTDRKLEKVG